MNYIFIDNFVEQLGIILVSVWEISYLLHSSLIYLSLVMFMPLLINIVQCTVVYCTVFLLDIKSESELEDS